MHTKWLPTLVVGLSIGITGCGSSTPGTSNPNGTDGEPSTGPSTVGPTTVNPTTGGNTNVSPSSGTTSSTTSGVAPSSSTNPGNTSSAPTDGSTSSSTGSPDESSASSDTSPSSSSTSSDSNSGDSSASSGATSDDTGSGSAAVRSKGCGVTDGAQKVKAGGSSVANGLPTSTRLSISSGGSNREYIIDIPSDYDPNRPYRLIFSWHQAYGSNTGNAVGQYPANNGPNFDAKNYAYFGLHREATAANAPAIFVAPGGIGNFPWDYNRDVALFDALLAHVTTNLCIDESRVFTTGFSFGAMMSHALSIGRASKLRAAVTMAPANYNFTQPPSDGGQIAYFGITGMSDGTCPWVNNDGNKTGGKYCVLTHAEDNGCTIPGNITTAMVGSKKHVCQDFEGCKDGHPVKVCTFDGNHTPSAVADGNNGGDDGLKAFVPPLAWEFISQF